MSTHSNTTTATLVPDKSEKVGKTPLPPPLQHVTAHDEFWFQDGNPILVARDVAFRVYRGLLSEQSTVFADLFAASSADVDELCDGCPVVHLCDSAEDLTHLFRILLPNSRRRLRPSKSEDRHTFDEISALVRLSHKYHIQDLEEQALDDLRDVFTDDLSRAYESCPFSGPVIPRHCIGAVNIARLTNTPSLLPSALYLCCMLGSPVLDGWTREDGYVEHLSAEDVKRCFAAQEKLCKERSIIFSHIFHDEPSSDCTGGDQCRDALKNMVLDTVRVGISWAIGRGVLDKWTDVIKEEVSVHKPCAECDKELQRRDVLERQRVWMKLPVIFSISVPGWGARSEAVGVATA